VGFDFSVIGIYLFISMFIVFVALLLGRFVRPSHPNPEKSQIYECGEVPIGSAWFNFNPRFYIVALVFIVFDVEIALTYPVATVVKRWLAGENAAVAMTEFVLFLAILFVALAWVWGRGDLDWIRDVSTPVAAQGAPEDAGKETAA
jgi:NADH-quinone oxidoreductase subunit A